ncbi:hypothetical protein [Bradyrhizobium sp. Leo121]|uniref:hypothetical protein n=1 Tax=Bradyrhizobium sp. Leo121 TaxID=1571195 RepID=UPI0013EEF68C|nr:hypothetical protein [Bradyrhizobium sp. Leo121]
MNRPEAARRMWRALATDALLPGYRPATISSESVAISRLVTVLAAILPRRGLINRRSGIAAELRRIIGEPAMKAVDHDELRRAA